MCMFMFGSFVWLVASLLRSVDSQTLLYCVLHIGVVWSMIWSSLCYVILIYVYLYITILYYIIYSPIINQSLALALIFITGVTRNQGNWLKDTSITKSSMCNKVSTVQYGYVFQSYRTQWFIGMLYDIIVSLLVVGLGWFRLHYQCTMCIPWFYSNPLFYFDHQ